MNSLSVSPEDAGADCYGKPASELQEGITIDGDKIKGTLHHVTGYTKFSGDTSEQTGHFLAMKVNVTEGATVKFKLVGGKGNLKTLPADDHQIVWLIAATTQKPHFEVTVNGETSTKEYDLSGLTLEGAG